MSSHDTSQAAEAVRIQVLRHLTSSERLQVAVEMSELTRGLSVARLRSRHPEWSDPDIVRELIRIAYLPSQPPTDLP